MPRDEAKREQVRRIFRNPQTRDLSTNAIRLKFGVHETIISEVREELGVFPDTTIAFNGSRHPGPAPGSNRSAAARVARRQGRPTSRDRFESDVRALLAEVREACRPDPRSKLGRLAAKVEKYLDEEA